VITRPGGARDLGILVDTERLRNPNNGLGQLCRRLGEELARQRPSDTRVTFLVPENQRGVFGAAVSYETPHWWQRMLPTGEYDVWHATHQDSAFVPSRRSRVILTVLDLNFLERADYGPTKKARKLATIQRKIDRASAIATISAYTASVVRANLQVPDIPVEVIYLGNPLPPNGSAGTRPRSDSTLASLEDGKPLLLFVGVLHPKKNVHTLLPALAQLPGWNLVLAGPDNHAYAAGLREQVDALGLRQRVVIPGAIDDETKRWLYQRCTALVFPSISEGFGLPVVEAMSYGKPTFLSRLTSLPEIGGDEAFYFDSFDPNDMAETIRRGLHSFAADPDWGDRLRRRAGRFSWERAATAYWSLYTRVAR
jgi:glycosyltransferase involved in cell wall biosynthesis